MYRYHNKEKKPQKLKTHYVIVNRKHVYKNIHIFYRFVIIQITYSKYIINKIINLQSSSFTKIILIYLLETFVYLKRT